VSMKPLQPTAPDPLASEIGRRQFLKTIGGGILVLCASTPDAAALQESGSRQFSTSREAPQVISAWLHVGGDGTVTVFTGKVEVGQNIRTSLAQAVAEELRVPMEAIRMVMGDTAQVPYDMGTFGSRTTPIMSPQLRRAAVAAREVILRLAAEAWETDPKDLEARDGEVVHSQKALRAPYADLTRGRELVETIPDSLELTPAVDWKVAGRDIPKVNGSAFVTGRHQYTSDLAPSGALCGKILRPPAFGSKLVTLEADKAKAISGVAVIHEGDFVGVTAPDEQTARIALRDLKAEWHTADQPNDREIFDYLRDQARQGAAGGRSAPQVTGSVSEGMRAAKWTLHQTYSVDYIAHAPLEPRAAVAQWDGGRLTVWTGTQRPFGVRDELCSAFGLQPDQVRVIMPDMGSGYGGKHTGDAAVEAARLARTAGKPVKLVWTREEEFTWAYFRPAGWFEIKSGVGADGRITAWEFHNYNSGPAAIRTYYDIPNQHIEFHPSSSPLRQGSYRALAATANHFARETHMDELAELAGLDPLEFRLRNLREERLRAVYEAAAEAFGWAAFRTGQGRGAGIAGGFEKGGNLATCAEVEVNEETGDVRVPRVVAAFECGAVINPDHLKSQIEGCLIMGLGGALFESIKFEQGRILNPRFSRYRVPRFSDLPQMEIVLLNRKDLPPAGGSEAPIMGIAPAIGNAIFRATGVRLRALPLVPEGKVAGGSSL
jgi:nicotinate dehydrogenase subunit B